MPEEDDDTLGEGRGLVPRREPKRCITRTYSKLLATKRWKQCNEWLKKVIKMGNEAPEKGWQRAEHAWTNGKEKHKKTLR